MVTHFEDCCITCLMCTNTHAVFPTVTGADLHNGMFNMPPPLPPPLRARKQQPITKTVSKAVYSLMSNVFVDEDDEEPSDDGDGDGDGDGDDGLLGDLFDLEFIDQQPSANELLQKFMLTNSISDNTDAVREVMDELAAGKSLQKMNTALKKRLDDLMSRRTDTLTKAKKRFGKVVATSLARLVHLQVRITHPMSPISPTPLDSASMHARRHICMRGCQPLKDILRKGIRADADGPTNEHGLGQNVLSFVVLAWDVGRLLQKMDAVIAKSKPRQVSVLL